MNEVIPSPAPQRRSAPGPFTIRRAQRQIFTIHTNPIRTAMIFLLLVLVAGNAMAQPKPKRLDYRWS
ncbi:MAG: hypothetical protein NTV08_12320 [Verrucomicrobia bacterium]|nr:hypothetical protein [Verrucomicrobiota bacterium]